jgi:phosphatidylserine/phosphatidylglycerophosphate/cardiolipin synthase-like enzyme
MTRRLSPSAGVSVPVALLVGIAIGWGAARLNGPERPGERPGPRNPGEAGWQVYFSPKGGCTDAVVRELGRAERSVKVLAYSFTSKPIAEALVAAHRRGVRVEVVLDSDQRTDKYSEADFLAHAGIPTGIDAKHAIAHNKVMVIDGKTVITGSFNFTRQAEERNAENLLVIRDRDLAARYEDDWQKHRDHAEPYRGKGP